MAARPGRFQPLPPVGKGGLSRSIAGGTAAYTADLKGAVTTARNLQGRYQSMQRQVQAAHDEMAYHAQNVIANYLEKRIRRHGRPQSDRKKPQLVQLLRAKEARKANIDGFVINPDGYLESTTAAPYYRNLEEGTDVFVGRELSGYFRSLEGRAYPARSDRLRQDPRLFQTGKFYAGRKAAKEGLAAQKAAGEYRPGAQKYGRASKKPKHEGRVQFSIIIRNRIEGYQYFRLGGVEYITSGDVKRMYRKHLGDKVQISGG